jgi:hypothetical protein
MKELSFTVNSIVHECVPPNEERYHIRRGSFSYKRPLWLAEAVDNIAHILLAAVRIWSRRPFSQPVSVADKFISPPVDTRWSFDGISRKATAQPWNARGYRTDAVAKVHSGRAGPTKSLSY